ncbi:MAG: hypothetical protein A2086_08265 [Spirochaetes bacterium GWD1_27_9]|nr:MAG: hypothetical protein A2Z98_01790 [Spirochaetes bacterium GWB1_27_13]OHD34513.1 MAG: hypothetical protein A2086_08265 [Spirochaetes bacterium GWD1_27_9]
MEKRKYVSLGVSLIIIGITFFISNLIEGFNWKYLWAIFFIIPIVSLISDFAASPETKKHHIFPIFLLSQLMVFFIVWAAGFHYEYMQQSWPFFVIITGTSLIAFASFKKEAKSLYIGTFLIILGITFLIFTFGIFNMKILAAIWPIFLVIGGIFIVIFYLKFKK